MLEFALFSDADIQDPSIDGRVRGTTLHVTGTVLVL